LDSRNFAYLGHTKNAFGTEEEENIEEQKMTEDGRIGRV
jgi:hypothetical protein